MDDPDDSRWSWPFWKFGLKRDDLFGPLHDQYNTVPSPILDPVAFHHDVYEISHQAASADEFHRLLDDRKQQRLRELNESLESAAFEIIANPSLIGTEQWHHAVQLFRTKSLDSLVRYFASFLPPDHPWYKSDSCRSDVGSSVGSLTDSHGSFFEDDEIPIMDEPFEYPSYPKQLLPASPRSMTMCSDSSVASPIDEHRDFDFGAATPARTLSFSESEPDCCALPEHCEVSPCTDYKYCGASVDDDAAATPHPEPRDGEATLPRRPTLETTDSETPTPKPEAQSASFFTEAKASLPQRRYRSRSPSRAHPLSGRDLDDVLAAHRDPRHPQLARLGRKDRECGPVMQKRRGRGGPADVATRIQKPLQETARSRPRSRRLADS